MSNLNFYARKILQENNALGYQKSNFARNKNKKKNKTLFELKSIPFAYLRSWFDANSKI